ncbi:MAG: tyrosine--tRNA ligase [Spirochaetales bacterium]|nr:tyrosine--tRNA ligase [Spirochaetales bacterium]
MRTEIERQLDVFMEKTVEVIPLPELRSKLKRSLESNTPLRIKIGIDPTAAKIHIGHMVPFRKIRQLQDLGHTAVLIIGDFTAQIGDPTGKNRERPQLLFKQVLKNAHSYTEQIFSILNKEQTEVYFNSEWFKDMCLDEFMTLAARFSLAQLMAHDSFRLRMEKGARLGVHELFYPMFQAFDSVKTKTDVEVGGNDQKFNILCGRDVMVQAGLKPQIVLLLPLLSGTDGQKMSKSLGNDIPVFSTAEDMVGKTMSIADDLIIHFFTYATDLNQKEITNIEKDLKEQRKNPRDIKLMLAREIVSLYHDKKTADQACREFLQVFSRKQAPSVIAEVLIKEKRLPLLNLLRDYKLVNSLSEARRLVEQGGVSIDSQKISDVNAVMDADHIFGKILKIGKRRFYKLTALKK